ncbi:MAG: hypothetical protein ACOX1X_08620 [Dethiobacteria bacterium]|jgi:hypothetical protein
MKLMLIQWLLQGIPECLAIATLSWILLERQFAAKKILSIGLLQALVAYLVRIFSVPFGIHTLIFIFSLAALLAYFSANFYYSRVLFVSLITFVVLGLFELIVLTAASGFLDIPVEAIFADPLLSVLTGLPQVAFLFLSAFLIARLKKRRKGIFKN